ncbi:MAG TPA: phosphoglycerate dehydrogenase [Bacillota bacterium]|nr:MAG: Glyoxylate/hydroxypyruvate reductase B [Firmicutes bacterium ADurb.Bin153]HNV35059.1 phosphoglycerate dehydrogenase [Bacillota bacterium]HPU95842.1 phosphoglycerate dehydrogenase [Bacillota bacterium]
MTMRILVTPRTFGKSDPVPLAMLEEAGCEVIRNPHGRVMTEDEMVMMVRGVDGIIVGLDPVTRRVIDCGGSLRAVSKYGVGVNNIDIDYANSKGIKITNTPGANSAAVAEHALGLLLSACRHISASDREIRQGKWTQHPGFQLEGKTMGIVGTGQIGRQVAERAKGLRMSVLCYDIYPDGFWAEKADVAYCSFNELLEKSDFISLHVPLVDVTYHMISANQLARMKKNAILVNTARGGIIDEDALYGALTNNVIAGAALDVFENEPVTNSPLKNLDNVVMTSHIGAHTLEAVQNMGRMAVKNLLESLAG